MTRNEAYKTNPELAQMTDFWMQHENRLNALHLRYQKDTGSQIPFIEFLDFIYHHAQDLVLNPQDL